MAIRFNPPPHGELRFRGEAKPLDSWQMSYNTDDTALIKVRTEDGEKLELELKLYDQHMENPAAGIMQDIVRFLKAENEELKAKVERLRTTQG